MNAIRLLPYGRQSIGEDDVAAMVAALGDDFLTSGPRVEEFEAAFAKATGAGHAVACNSGTAALHLAALSLDIGPGDGVIVPTMTFLATANAVRMTGAEVVFADVDPDTGLITAETLAAAYEAGKKSGLRMRAAFPVHLNGRVADMAVLAKAVPDSPFSLVEDACHALGEANIGATPHSRMACFSTHPVKTIATGEGGVVTTCDANIAQRLRQLRNHGMVREPDKFQNKELAFDGDTPNPWYYEMLEFGWNYRMPDILCALGISQLKKLEMFHRRRSELAAMYDRLTAALSPILRPVPHDNVRHGWHLYAVLVDFAGLGTSRRRFMQALRADGVGTQVHYIPVHCQPYYRKRYGDQRFPGADRYYNRCLSIPLYPAMSDADVERVVSTLGKTIAQHSGADIL